MDGFINEMSGLIMPACILFLVLLVFGLIVGYSRRVKRLETRAEKDPVTGGYNDFGFYCAAKKHFSGKKLQHTLVAMEVRNLSQIRKTFGNDNGDKVLIHLYKTLKSILSSSEPIARVSGKTFCFLLRNRDEEMIRARLNRICESANSFNGRLQVTYYLDLHFGVYLPEDPGESPAVMQEKAVEMLNCGDEESRYRFYEEEDGELPVRKWELIEQLDRSFHNHDFAVFLQPKVRVGDSRIVGAEALARWRHPQRGMLTPEMFIPLLEEYRMMYRFDRYLFEMICIRIAEWKKAGLKPCPVSVNLSGENLDMEHFAEEYANICKKYDVDPALIEFELSEKILEGNLETVREAIKEIHSYGFQCSLDNFGKNDIRLHLLRELDVDAIKLDGSFFCSENNSLRNRVIIEAILRMATQLRIRTVAQGIDNASQVQYLQQAGCDDIQGFYYFRPMSAEEFSREAYRDGDLRYVEEKTARTAQPAVQTARKSASARSIIMFSLLTEDDRMVFSEAFSPLLEGQLVINNATALMEHTNLIHENDRKDFFHLLERCRKEVGWVEDTLRFYTSEGRYEWLEVHLHKETLGSPNEMVISGTLVNITEWKNEVNQWKEKANRDALTGLYNREFFEQTASSTIKKGALSSAALVFIDIDDFKNVNDTLGHMVGDDVICWFAKRILGVFRHTDVVARYGGDEFVVFANGIGREDLEKRLTQLCEVFRYPYRNDTVEYQASGSIGAALFPQDGADYRELLDHADCALYTAKNQGKNQFVLYEPGMEEVVSRD